MGIKAANGDDEVGSAEAVRRRPALGGGQQSGVGAIERDVEGESDGRRSFRMIGEGGEGA